MFPIYLLQLQSTTQAQGAKPATTAPLDWCRGRTGDAEKMGNPLPGQGYNFRLLFTLFRNVVAVVLLVSVLPTDLLPHFLSHSSSILHYITIIISVLLLLHSPAETEWTGHGTYFSWLCHHLSWSPHPLNLLKIFWSTATWTEDRSGGDGCFLGAGIVIGNIFWYFPPPLLLG